MTHTPTPWQVGQYQRELDDDGEEVLVTGLYSHVNGVKVGKMEVWTGEEYRKESDANAEFVVRACNAHEELVKSLQECVEQLEMIPFYEKTNSDIVAVTNAKRILKSIEKSA